MLSRVIDIASSWPVAQRKPWPRGYAERVLNKTDNPHGPGNCWHCGKQLHSRAQWHIDHWPIPRRHIVDQLCCGVTDELDINNLVPACVRCNTSHVAETGDKWYLCGRTQCCCTMPCVQRILWTCLGCSITTLVAGTVWLVV